MRGESLLRWLVSAVTFVAAVFVAGSVISFDAESGSFPGVGIFSADGAASVVPTEDERFLQSLNQQAPDEESGEAGGAEAGHNVQNAVSKGSYDLDELAALPLGEAPFEIVFLDVGQGDSAIVRCGESYMLVDGGPPDASSKLYSYCNKHGISHFDYVIATHPDTDHTGGISGALEVATAGSAFCSATEAEQRSFNALVTRLEGQGVTLEVPSVGKSWMLGDAEVVVVGPAQVTDDGDYNNDSIMLLITYGSTSYVFTGDADEVEEKGSLPYLQDCDVLKVAHHGSASSSCYEFLRTVLPEIAVICVGEDNEYGHPTDEALSRLDDCGAVVYRTDLHGDVRIVSDGQVVAVAE